MKIRPASESTSPMVAMLFDHRVVGDDGLVYGHLKQRGDRWEASVDHLRVGEHATKEGAAAIVAAKNTPQTEWAHKSA